MKDNHAQINPVTYSASLDGAADSIDLASLRTQLYNNKVHTMCNQSKRQPGNQIPPGTPRVDRLEEGHRQVRGNRAARSSGDIGKPIQRFMEMEIQALTAALGHVKAQELLKLLAIDRSNIVDPEQQRRLIDTVHLVGRAFGGMSCDSLFDWLTQPEPLLGNRLPPNVLRTANGLRTVGDRLMRYMPVYWYNDLVQGIPVWPNRPRAPKHPVRGPSLCGPDSLSI